MRRKRYIWLPLILLLYGIAMAIWFGPDFIQSGRAAQLTIAVIADVIICILLFFALRKKAEYRK